MSLQVKWVYEPRFPFDDQWILIDHSWPSNIDKSKINHWYKELAPTSNVIMQYKEALLGLEEFNRNYSQQISNHLSLIKTIAETALSESIVFAVSCCQPRYIFEQIVEKHINPFIFEHAKQKVSSLEHKIEKEPEAPIHYAYLSLIMLAIGENSNALKCLNKALSLNLNDKSVVRKIGREAYIKVQPEIFHQCYSRLLDLDPNDSEALWALGWLLQEEDIDESIRLLSLSTKQNDSFVDAWISLGVCLGDVKKHKESEACFKKAIDLEPANYKSWLALGGLASVTGNIDEGIDHFKKAIKYHPLSSDAWRSLGIAYEQGKNDYLEAEKCFYNATQYSPFEPSSWFLRGKALFELEKYADTIDSFNKVKELDSDYQDLNEWLARVHFVSKDYDLALAFCKMIPENLMALYISGCIYLNKDQYNVAEKAFSKLLSICPHLSDTENKLGYCLSMQERYSEALVHFRHATEINPDSYLGWLNQGVVLRIMGKYDEAIEKIKKAEEITPDYAPIHIELASVLAMQEEYSSALVHIKKAHELEPDSLMHLIKLWGLYAVIRDYKKANKVLAKIEDRHSDYTPLSALKIFNSFIIDGSCNPKKSEIKKILNYEPTELFEIDLFARTYACIGNKELANKYIEILKCKYPSDSILFNGLIAVLYAFVGETRKARSLFKQIFDQGCNNQEWLHMYGVLLLYATEYHQAEKVFSQVDPVSNVLESNMIEGYKRWASGMHLFSKSQFVDAEVHFNKASRCFKSVTSTNESMLSIDMSVLAEIAGINGDLRKTSCIDLIAFHSCLETALLKIQGMIKADIELMTRDVAKTSIFLFSLIIGMLKFNKLDESMLDELSQILSDLNFIKKDQIIGTCKDLARKMGAIRKAYHIINISEIPKNEQEDIVQILCMCMNDMSNSYSSSLFNSQNSARLIRLLSGTILGGVTNMAKDDSSNIYFIEGPVENIIEQKGKGSSVVINETSQNDAKDDTLELKTEYQYEELNLKETKKKALKNKFPEIITDSPKMFYVLSQVEEIAPIDSAVVFIGGDTGTGKELIAKAVRDNSKRAAQPFITRNITAIPTEGNFLETVLFGMEKGKLRKDQDEEIGIFEQANGGTVFLDEIADAHPKIQLQLLRVIQEKEVTRFGGKKPVSVDFRLITATSMPLNIYVQEGRFKKDLYYRIFKNPIYLPPLSERDDDAVLLAEHFLSKHVTPHKRKKATLSKDAIGVILNYTWPGNIRELESVIEDVSIRNREKAQLSGEMIRQSIMRISRNMLPQKIYSPISRKKHASKGIVESLMAYFNNSEADSWNDKWTEACKKVGRSKSHCRKLLKKVMGITPKNI